MLPILWQVLQMQVTDLTLTKKDHRLVTCTPIEAQPFLENQLSNLCCSFIKPCRDPCHTWSQPRVCLVTFSGTPHLEDYCPKDRGSWAYHTTWRQCCLHRSAQRRLHQRWLDEAYISNVLLHSRAAKGRRHQREASAIQQQLSRFVYKVFTCTFQKLVTGIGIKCLQDL